MSDVVTPQKPAGIEVAQAAVSPTDSLRSPQFVISILAVLMIGAGFGYNTVYGDPTTKQTVLTALVGLSGVVYGYWLGSSKSSQAKDDKALPLPPAVVPVVATGGTAA